MALLLVSLPFAGLLVACTLRRALFLAAALLPGRRDEGAAWPSVTLLVPAADEAAGLDDTLDALGRLDYPGELRLVLVSDGSTDGTAERFHAWAAGRAVASVVELERRSGKFAALGEAIAGTPRTEVIAVCDADLRPRPDWLRRIVAPLADPRVGAAAGYLAPANARSSAVARYAAVESWVHQLVTSAAKDRLGLDPPTLGACAYRRTAFDRVGGFGGEPSGEDVRTTAALVRAGWRTRFVRDAVVDNRVVDNVRDYWHQHVRWARNLVGLGRARRRAPRPGGSAPVGFGRRLEAWLTAVGYADRVAFVAVTAFALGGVLPWWLPVAYVAVATAEVVLAVLRGGGARGLPLFLLATAGVFALDVAASAAALLAHAARRPRTWRRHLRATG